jgi:tRNAThr (cytosine32-N3)-methyltransferase
VEESLKKQRAARVPLEDHTKYNEKPARHWDNFYKANTGNFFKDRKWLHLEFPEVTAAMHPNAGPIRILEVGCGQPICL